MSMRNNLRLLTFTTILILMASCSGNSSSNSVTFMVFGDPAERDAYLSLVAEFEEKHPDIDVEVTHIPSPRDYRTRLATEYAAGSPPDVSLMNYRRYGSFAASGLLEPLGERLDSSNLIQPEDFYPITLDSFHWQGELMCIPQNISSLVVYYNMDLFDDAELTYPSDHWTWDEFLETAVALTKDLNGNGRVDQYGLGTDTSFFRLIPFVWQNEAPIVDNTEFPKRLTLTRPPSLAAFEWFVELQTVHGVIPDRIAEASQDSESRFIAGTVGMFLNSRRGTPSYREIESFEWDVAPLPQGESAAGILHSDAYCLSSVSGNKEAAWTFIEFANSPEGQTIIASSGRTVPSLRAVAESDIFLNPGLPPARSQVWLNTISTLRIVPVMSTWQEVESVAGEEFERALYGDISAEEAAMLSFIRTEEYFRLAVFGAEE
ncbi:MAG: sugar ABC transporter substrate-binding protein [Chloroflexota bacterium]